MTCKSQLWRNKKSKNHTANVDYDPDKQCNFDLTILIATIVLKHPLFLDLDDLNNKHFWPL